MEKLGGVFLFGAVVLVLWAAVNGGQRSGRRAATSELQNTAIERGHAEWALKNGGPEVEFRWKEIGKCGLKVEESAIVAEAENAVYHANPNIAEAIRVLKEMP